METQTLHKACGTVEVARDLVGRSGRLFLQAENAPDRYVASCFDEAVRALTTVVQALKLKLNDGAAMSSPLGLEPIAEPAHRDEVFRIARVGLDLSA